MASAFDAAILDLPISRPDRMGPVTRRRIARTLLLYALTVLCGAVPLILRWNAGWQAAGIGLWFPGAGYLAVDGWALLLFPVTLALFALAVFFWFGAGMIIAPPLVWLGTAALAGSMAGETITAASPFMAAICAVACLGWSTRQRTRALARGEPIYAARVAALPEAHAAARACAVPADPPEQREMTAEQLLALRYAIDRGLQPLDRWSGFDVIDEFQTAARRYQINFLGYALALSQHDYTPSFHGYLSSAQRGLIDRYLLPEVWRYWI